jgi:hypothetical protein
MSTSSFGLSTHPIIILHHAGDVTLLIGTGTKQQSVRVSTISLRLASPVWKAIFERHWVESEASEITLPEDNVEAMLLVLRIAHLRFKELPAKNGLSLQALLDLAIVCDRYDVVSIVRPVLELYDWTIPYEFSVYLGRTNYEWLFVAWTFGYSDSFDSLARDLALNITCSDPETFVWSYFGRAIESELLPPDILGESLSSSGYIPQQPRTTLYCSCTQLSGNLNCVFRKHTQGTRRHTINYVGKLLCNNR